MRQWDTSRVPIIKLYCDEITIFLQIQGSCGLGEQKTGLGTNIRVQIPRQGSGDMGEDRDPAPVPKHHVPTFPRLCRERTEGLLCNGKSRIILHLPTQCKISQSTTLLQNINNQFESPPLSPISLYSCRNSLLCFHCSIFFLTCIL